MTPQIQRAFNLCGLAIFTAIAGLAGLSGIWVFAFVVPVVFRPETLDVQDQPTWRFITFGITRFGAALVLSLASGRLAQRRYRFAKEHTDILEQPPSAPIATGTYCPDCGYDLRSLTSDRCPECGLPINSTLSGLIPWEQRKGIGYARSFFRTLVIATFKPTQLARATGCPIDLRSARLYRWIARGLTIIPVISLFTLVTVLNGGPGKLALATSPAQGPIGPPWEPLFLWSVGATFWPTIPIGLVIAVMLTTGISHWLFMRRLEPVRRNRAMAFSFYLCSPLAWIFVPCIVCAAGSVLADADLVGSSNAIDNMFYICGLVAGLSMLVLLLAILNSVRAINAATHCGLLRAIMIAAGIVIQAVASWALGLVLFPVVIGLFRLMIGSLWR